MEDTTLRRFFEQPANPYHRQYEALRAIFVDGRRQKEVAEEFGYAYGTLRQLVHQFRQHCDNDDDAKGSPFFEI